MSVEGDFHNLGLRILETLRSHPELFGHPKSLDQLPRPIQMPNLPEFVLESEAGLLLGEPPARSLSLALPIAPGVGEAEAWCFGPPLTAAARQGHPCSFLQLLLVESTEPISRPVLSRVSSLRSLTGRLPGYLAHTVGHETTGRVHGELLNAGLTMEHLAAAHRQQALARGLTGTFFVAVGVPSHHALELLAPFVLELKLVGEKLSSMAEAAARQEMAQGCEGRTCSDCNDRDVCDKVRAVLAAHAANTRTGGTIP